MRIFISYAHHDEAACAELRQALAPLERVLPETATWHDGKILPGQYWAQEIVAALDAADLILLLISNAFFASKFCWEKEMTRALGRHKTGAAVVVPIIVDFIGDIWMRSDFARLHVLPKGAKPIPDWDARARGWADVCNGLEALLLERRLLPPPTDAEDPFNRPFADSGRGGFHIPRPENPFFTGRDDALDWIGRTLRHSNRNWARPVALLHGTGGVGKSETAAQYAHVNRDAYQVAWWIDAETPAGRDEGFFRLAMALNLPDADPRDPAATRQAVKRWLADNAGWLLVFDNAESPADLQPWLPARAAGHLLATSRNPAWRAVADVLPVEAWDIPTAAAFLQDRTGDADHAAAEALAAELGGLPLACEVAAAYAETAGIGLGEYLRRLRQDFTQAAGPVKRVFRLAMQAATDEEPLAGAVMDLCGRLAPEPIPRRLFYGEKAAQVLARGPERPDDFAVDRAFAALRKRGLTQGQDHVLILHRLVRETARQDKDDPKVLDFAALFLATAAFPQGKRPATDARNWADCAALRPHAETLLAAVDDADAPPNTVGLLCNQLGIYLQQRGDYAEALALYQRSLKLTEEHFGPTHGKTAATLSNLGTLLRDMGRLDEAEVLARRALEIEEANLGPDHSAVATRLSNLATTLMDQQRWEEAEQHLRRALAIDERELGADHPSVAIDLSNLSQALSGQGKHNDAKPLAERALAISRHEYGDDHPTIAYYYNNLGVTLLGLGDAAKAAAHLRQALAIREKWLGPDHPLTLETRINLADAEAALRRDDASGRGAP